jgi:hypothetical protein
MSAVEKHYTVSELAKIWQLSDDVIRNLFRHRAGVLCLTSPKKLTRRYTVLRIPESVVQEAHRELRIKPATLDEKQAAMRQRKAVQRG